MTDVLPLSLFFCFVLWALNKFSNHSRLFNLRKAPQTYHKKSTSRFGGMAIFASLLIVTYLTPIPEYEYLNKVLLCTLPIFVLGLADDLKVYIKPNLRLLLAIPTPVLYFFLLDLRVESTSIEYIDILLKNSFFSLIFLTISIIGISNAFNIIDGFNGLLMTYCFLLTISILSLSGEATSLDWTTYNVAIFLAISGVYIFNFPLGKIFLGDGGTYLLGSLMSVGLINFTFDNNLSPWFIITLYIYPITEVFFSTVRKKLIRKKSALDPDGLHLHMLVYKRLSRFIGFRKVRARHFFVTCFISILYLPFMIAANLMSTNTLTLVFLCLWFIFLYTLIYFLLLPKYIIKKLL